jgi:hypothetical protein
VTENSGTSRSVYDSNAPYYTPKLVVTQYLQPLGFPAMVTQLTGHRGSAESRVPGSLSP